MLSFIDTRTLYTIFHLIGVALGSGAAVATDAIFLTSLRDGTISKSELRFVRLGSVLVWGGLVLIVVSGLLLYSLDPARLAVSSKYQAKIVIVSVLALNGLLFHVVHLPWLERRTGKPLATLPGFARQSGWLTVSGVVSATSWLFALVLGSLQSVPYSAGRILSMYLALVVLGTGLGWLARGWIWPRR